MDKIKQETSPDEPQEAPDYKKDTISGSGFVDVIIGAICVALIAAIPFMAGDEGIMTVSFFGIIGFLIVSLVRRKKWIFLGGLIIGILPLIVFGACMGGGGF